MQTVDGSEIDRCARRNERSRVMEVRRCGESRGTGAVGNGDPTLVCKKGVELTVRCAPEQRVRD
jgi:hypothetical protein